MKSWRDYDADFEARIVRYREGAQRLRSAAKTMSSDQRAGLFEIATQLEQLADAIAGLLSAMSATRAGGDDTDRG